MNRKLLVALVICFTILLTVAFVSAAPFDSVIENQRQRINQGIKSGLLSQEEAAILRDNLNHVRTKRNNAIANDGRLSNREKASIQRMLDRNDRMIRRMKNNSIMRVY
jgi:hypothetical protein